MRCELDLRKNVMRIPVILTVIGATVALAVVLVAGSALIQPGGPLLTRAEVSPDTITPNADGSDDVTIVSYSLSRNARVSISFEAENGLAFSFRKDESRIAGDYTVQFSGVVDGFTLPDENIGGQVERRLMPDGRYTWRVQAVGENGETEEKTGTLTIQNGDKTLPELKTFTVSPDVFTPNQDGISDRTQINVYLSKAADLTVYLQGADGSQLFIPERQEGRKPGEAGRHQFDYDGGIDQGSDPPPDGEYQVIATAQDAVGQRVTSTGKLTIQSGGVPDAEIAPQPIGVDVVFARAAYDPMMFSDLNTRGQLAKAPDDPKDLSMTSVVIPVGDLLVFKLTVDNYGDVPIRTGGPWPGTVYQQDQNAATLGEYDQSGAWRVGISCDTAKSDYPWRWGVGPKENLQAKVDPVDGNTYYYLPAGASSVVWGAVRMTDLVKARNPQNCWAGLIHEDVEVSVRNSHVGARAVQLLDPNANSGS
jgi:flagellar hook assembly protein FlgD